MHPGMVRRNEKYGRGVRGKLSHVARRGRIQIGIGQSVQRGNRRSAILTEKFQVFRFGQKPGWAVILRPFRAVLIDEAGGKFRQLRIGNHCFHEEIITADDIAELPRGMVRLRNRTNEQVRIRKVGEEPVDVFGGLFKRGLNGLDGGHGSDLEGEMG